MFVYVCGCVCAPERNQRRLLAPFKMGCASYFKLCEELDRKGGVSVCVCVCLSPLALAKRERCRSVSFCVCVCVCRWIQYKRGKRKEQGVSVGGVAAEARQEAGVRRVKRGGPLGVS